MVNTEHIGLLLWNQEKEGPMKKVNEYVSHADNLTIKEIYNLSFVNKEDRAAFVRNMYPGETIPNDNPKIASSADISFVVVEDTAPHYEHATTGGGKYVYLNVNSANLKKYVRQFYHWKYLHSTDYYSEFFAIIKHAADYALHNPVYPEAAKYGGYVIDVADLYGWHCGTDMAKKFTKRHISDFEHYSFVKGYLEKKSMDDFRSSSAYKGYVDYIDRETKWYGNCHHSPEKFINLIDNFDLKNYNSSPFDKLVKVMGVSCFKKSPSPPSRWTGNSWVQFRLTKLDAYISDRFDDGLVRCNLADNIGTYPREKVELDIRDGAHRSAILAYRKAKYILVGIKPYNLSAIHTSKAKQVERGVQKEFFKL